jgi:hypothetical protein
VRPTTTVATTRPARPGVVGSASAAADPPVRRAARASGRPRRTLAVEDAAFMLKVLLYLLPLALAIYALVDLVQTKEDEVQGLPKLAWVGLIVVFWVIGPIAWLLAG